MNIAFGATAAATGATAFTFTSVVGGAGTDTINLGDATTRMDFSTAVTAISLANISGVENVNVYLNDLSAATTASGLTITAADANVAAGGSMNLNLLIAKGTSAGSGGVLAVNGAAELDGALNVTVTQTGTVSLITKMSITGGAGSFCLR
jgi:hypothetical protein